MYYKGKYDKIIEGLERVDWESEFVNKTVQECWDIFRKKLEELVAEYIPMTKPRTLMNHG